jgi:hypothetical protein
MMSMADMAAIMRLAAERGCRVLITGDHEQLAAVEGGGGMMMLTRQMGYVQLAEPVRFAQQWERDASLRLRSGDVSVLVQYQEQGRLRGGDPEEAMEQACRGWLADHLSGRDCLLLARTGEQARELSRRVRDDLIRYGLVEKGAQVKLRHGAVASVGNLITARKNDRRIVAGQPGRWLTNRDVLQVQAVSGTAVTVRRLAGRDQDSAAPVWSGPFELPRTYIFSHCDLAYATTPHAIQGRTADTAHLLVDGLGDSRGLYVGMSRGREANYAYCVTGFPRAADPRGGTRPAPELARTHKLTRERTGLSAAELIPADSRQLSHQLADPVTVLAGVLRQDHAALSATETLSDELSNADHLGVLGSIWYDLTRRAQATRFEQVLRKGLSRVHAEAALGDAACTWLWRSLRQAEAAGLDAAQVLRAAIAERPLDGARHPARVIDSRVRRLLEPTVPQIRKSWSQRIAGTGDPELDRFIIDLAQAMDDRVRRIGEHLAQTPPRWAVHALGEPPAEPGPRTDWKDRAARLGAYRELYGYQGPDAIGPEPGKTSPEANADWHSAFAALGRVDGIDLRGRSDDQLHLLRGTYERETSWAPSYVGEELRLARLQARTAFENRVREQHEAQAANPVGAGRHEQLAGMWQAMESKAASVAGLLAEAHETRLQWEALTEPTRRMALAADRELRSRHPGRFLEPLKSAEPSALVRPEPASSPGPEVWVQETLDGAVHLPDAAGKGYPAGHDGPSSQAQRDVIGQQILGLTPRTVDLPVPEQVLRIRENARVAQARIDDLRATRVPGEDHEAADLGPAWKTLARPDRGAIIQPPKPEVVPAAGLLQQARQQQADREPEHA